MKKLYFIISCFLLTGISILAQNKSLHIYRNGSISYAIEVSQIDSMRVVDFSNETFTANGVSFDMIAVNGGTFTMGLAGTTVYGPTIATVSNFKIGKTEVTQGLWYAVMGSYTQTQNYGSGSNYPVYYVSWNDIVGTSSSAAGYTVNGVTYYQNGFCYKLSQLTGGGRQFILPTETQWEYAARGGSGTGTYYAGTDSESSLSNYAWYSANSGITSHPVATKQPNALGIYDMSGNVFEWCSDWWQDTYAGGTNPTGPSSGSARVLRGGSWSNSAHGSRSAYRFSLTPDFRNYDYGFRLALVP